MLFGTGSAKFTTTNGSATVLLEYCNIQPDWCLRNIGVRTSIYDHYHTYEFRGDYSEFTVVLNLHKYDDPSVKFQEIYPYIYTEVYFWPHVDAYAVSGSNPDFVVGGPVVPEWIPSVFFIDSMEHSYYSEDYVEKDILNIHFKSVRYTSLTGSIVPYVPPVPPFNDGYPYFAWELD